MEVAGLVIGAVGLAAMFSTCVECFEYIQIGRHLGTDYETAVVKLDLIRLRLTRWGTAAGLAQFGQEPDDVVIPQLKKKLALSDADFETIKRTLGKIIEIFQKSAETSRRMSLKQPKQEVAEPTVNETQDKFLDNLHTKMRKLAISRQKGSSLRQKVSWALYRKKDFEDLLENLSWLVSELVELAPVKSEQEELCEKELIEIDSKDEVVMLDRVLAQQIEDGEDELDSMLRGTIDRYKEKNGISTLVWTNTEVGDLSYVQQGDNTATDRAAAERINYFVGDSKIGKGVFFHQGHNFYA